VRRVPTPHHTAAQGHYPIVLIHWLQLTELGLYLTYLCIIRKIIYVVYAPPVLSSAALVQLNHSVVLMKIIVLVKGKEAVLDTSVMQLEYHGYCLMSSQLYQLLIFCDMFHPCLLLVNVYTKGPVTSPFPLSISSLVISILCAAYVK